VVRATASLQGFLRLQTALALSPALPAGEPRVRSPELIDSASVELGCPRIVIWILGQRNFLPGNVVQESCWTLSYLPPWPSVRHQTTPLPVVRWLQGEGFCLSKLSNCCIGCCREGRAGRGAEATSKPTAYFRVHEFFRKPWTGAIFTAAYSLAPGSIKLANLSMPIVPASPNRPAVPDARCPLHLSYTGCYVFIVGVDNVL